MAKWTLQDRFSGFPVPSKWHKSGLPPAVYCHNKPNSPGYDFMELFIRLSGPVRPGRTGPDCLNYSNRGRSGRAGPAPMAV